jgi:hypothetical protein
VPAPEPFFFCNEFGVSNRKMRQIDAAGLEI